MEAFKTLVKSIDAGELTQKQLVSILVLCVHNLNINTISEMSRIENKTPRGIRISNNYTKINIGKQVLAIKGVKQDTLPF